MNRKRDSRRAVLECFFKLQSGRILGLDLQGFLECFTRLTLLLLGQIGAGSADVGEGRSAQGRLDEQGAVVGEQGPTGSAGLQIGARQGEEQVRVGQ